MDGGGRLARSKRSPRPRTDLKPAADSAVARARAFFAFLLSPVKGHRLGAGEHTPRFVAALERRLPRRAGLFATLLLLLTSAGLGVVKGGHLEKVLVALSDSRNALANSAGFRISSVLINGRNQ